MNYAKIEKFDISDGPGIRVALFLQGCTLRCPGCFNSQIWDFNGGLQFTWTDTIETIIELVSKPYISGLTLLGGEPLDNDLEQVKKVIDTVKNIPGKTVWVYTGHTFESLSREQKEAIANADVLVDGPFIEALKDRKLAWRGSSNQRIIDIQQTRLKDTLVLVNKDYLTL